jgi:hypothetical protein
MTMDELREFLIWCTAINYGVIVLWFSMLILAHDWLYQAHAHWFRISVETFDALHYAGLSMYKIGVLLFNLVPLIVLFIIS